MADFYLKEDGTGHYQLEDGSGSLVLDFTPKFAWVQGNSFQSSSVGTTIAVTLGSIPTPGNLICVVVQADTFVSLQDENGNNYTVTPNSPSAVAAATSGLEWAAYLIAPANAGKILTWTGSGVLNSAAIFADEFSFTAGYQAIFDTDVAGTGTTGTSINSPITPAGAGELLYAGAAVESNITASGSPWTGASTGLGGAIGSYAEYLLSSPSGATALNFTQGGSAHWDSMAMAFKLVQVVDKVYSVDAYVQVTNPPMRQFASDSFIRANANPVGSPWTTLVPPTGTFGDLQILSNVLLGTADGSSGAYYSGGNSWPADQYSEITVGTNSNTINPAYQKTGVRIQPDGSGYWVYYGKIVGSPDDLRIEYVAPITGATVNLTAIIHPGILLGDKLRIAVVGSVITVYLNGVQIQQVVDTNQVSGRPGILINNNSNISPWDKDAVAGWSAGFYWQYGIDAYLAISDVSKIFSADAYLQTTTSKTFSADAYIKTDSSKSHLVDATVQVQQPPMLQFAFDNFTRANSNPIGAPWISISGDLQIVSNLLEGSNAGSRSTDAYDGGVFWPNDQYSEITFNSIASTASIAACVRLSINNGYYGSYGISPSPHIVVYKIVSSTQIQLINFNTTALIAGDKLRLSIVGATLSLYINGTLLYQTTDSDLISGKPGIALGANTLTDAKVSFWSGGFFWQYGIDAYIKSFADETHSVDAYIQSFSSKTANADAYVTSATPKIFSVDAYIQSYSDKSHGIDAYVTSAIPKIFSVDAYIQSFFDKLNFVDAIVQIDTSKTFNVDAYIQTPQSAFTWVQGNSLQSSSLGTTIAVTLGSLPTPGNLICVVAQVDSLVSIQDENGNNYTVTPNSPSNAAAATSGIEWAAYLIAPANAGKTITITGSGVLNAGAIFVDEFSFTAGYFAVFDTDVAGTGIGATVNSPITPSSAGELLYGGSAVQSSITASGSPWTGASTGLGGAVGSYAEYLLSSPSGATGLNFTQSSSQDWDSMAMAFKLVQGVDKLYSADAYVIADNSKTSSADAYIQFFYSKTLSADAYISLDSSKTSLVDAIVRQDSSKTFNADAFIQIFNDKSYSVNAIVQQDTSKSFNADAFVQAFSSKTYNADAYISLDTSKSYNSDAYVQAYTDKPYSVNAVVQIDSSKIHSVDCYVLVDASKTTIVDAAVQIDTSKSYNSDAYIQFFSSKTVTIDAIVQVDISKTTNVDAYVQSYSDRQSSVDAYVQAFTSKSFNADAYVLVDSSKFHNVDCYVRVDASKTFSADAYAGTDSDKAYLVDAVVQTGFSFVQGKNSVVNSTSPSALAYDSPNSAGNLLVITGRGNIGGNSVSVSDSQGNTWVIFQLNVASGNQHFQGYALNCNAGFNTVTVTAPGQTITFAIAEYSGVVSFDTQTSQAFTGTNPNSGNITTANDNELLIGVTGLTISATTAGAGYTLRQGGAIFLSCIEDDFINSAGTNSASFVETTGTTGVGIMAFAGTPYVSVVHSADAYIRADSDETHSIDARVQTDSNKTYAVDAYVSVDSSKTFSADAYVQVFFSKTSNVDAYVIADTSKSFNVDSFVRADTSKTINVDAYIQIYLDKQFLTDAVVQIDTSKTYSVDAYTFLSDISKSYSLDCIVQTDSSKTFSLDAYVKTDTSKSYNVDCYVQVDTSKIWTADSYVQTDASKSYSVDAYAQIYFDKTNFVDAIVKTDSSTSHNVDCYVQFFFSKSYSVDCLVQIDTSKLYSADAYVLADSSKTFLADCYVQTDISKIHSVDCYVLVNASKSYNIDAIIQTETLKTFNADTYIQFFSNKSSSVDVVVQIDSSKSSSVDCYVLVDSSKTYSTDADVAADVFKTYLADAYVTMAGEPTYAVDAVVRVDNSRTSSVDTSVQIDVSKTSSSDAYILQDFSKTDSADAYIQTANSINFLVDAVVRVDLSTTFSADAYVQSFSSKIFSADAYAQTDFSKSYLIDAYILTDSPRSFSADAYIFAFLDKTFSVDADVFVVGVFNLTHLSDALVQIDSSKTFSADALLQIDTSNTLFVDAYIKQDISKTYNVDAYVTVLASTTYSVDALVISDFSFSHNIDCVISIDNSKSFSVDADVIFVPDKSFNVDADVTGDVSKSYGVDSIIQKASEIEIVKGIQFIKMLVREERFNG